MTNPKPHKVRSLIFRILLIIIAGLTVGFSVYSWNASRVVGNQLPMPFGIGASVVLTGSMEPTLMVNDLVLVKEEAEYHEDDIVVYQQENQLIIHRIIRIDEDQVITKGDANNVADDPIYLNQIKGKFIFRIPFIGFVFKILKTVPGTLAVLALVVFLMYRSRRKERKKNEDDVDKIVAEIKALKEQQYGAATKPDSAAVAAPEDKAPETADPVDTGSDPEPSDLPAEAAEPADAPTDDTDGDPVPDPTGFAEEDTAPAVDDAAGTVPDDEVSLHAELSDILKGLDN